LGVYRSDPLQLEKSEREVKVTVVDALMGSGKTRTAKKMMDAMCQLIDAGEEDAPRFIYVTPFLDEVRRIKEDLGWKALIDEPQQYNEKGKGQRKLHSLNEMLLAGKCIVSTHALFAYADESTKAAVEEHRYVLIIDEVADWVEQYPITTHDLRDLFKVGRLTIDPATKRVQWNDPAPEQREDGRWLEGKYRGRFEDLRSLCKLGKIVASRFRSTGEPTLLLWQFPIEMLDSFEEVYILTHLFDGSDMAAYMRLHGVNVEKMTVGRDGQSLIPYDAELERERVQSIRPLITVVQEESLNAIGRTPKGRRKRKPLSKGWFDYDSKKNGHKLIDELRRNLVNFYTNYVKTPASENMWSTYQTHEPMLRGNGYSQKGRKVKGGRKDQREKGCFEPCVSRATNEQGGRRSLAYCVSLYHHPYIRGWFQDAGVTVSEDFYALLTMTQWIWRSAIRNRQPITAYIPSDRMRNLFLDWLDGQLPGGTTEDAPDETDDIDGSLTADLIEEVEYDEQAEREDLMFE
jgi:hypothetical protein